MRDQSQGLSADSSNPVPGNDTAGGTRPSLREILSTRGEAELRELVQFWTGNTKLEGLGPVDQARARVLDVTAVAASVHERVLSLGRRLTTVVDVLLEAPGYVRTLRELAEAKSLSFLSEYDLESCLTALARRAVVVETRSNRADAPAQRAFALVREVGDGLLLHRRTQESGLWDALTLRGYLDRSRADQGAGPRSTPQRVREMYKLYSTDSAAVARIERLPDGVRDLVEKAILEFGGLLPRSVFERMKLELAHWNGKRWGMILESSLVGTVQRLDLTPYGINHDDETLIVFTEVALAWLRKVAVPGDPDRPHEELSLGVDLVSNVSRFLAFVHENDVRYTVRGEIFKTTEKKILQELIPNPGRELSREEVLEFIFGYCRATGLVEVTGERTFAVASAGRAFEQLSLQDKLRSLLDFALDERGLAGDDTHQLRMRPILMRWMKRIEQGTWYDLMYLPFIARNQYLSNLDEASGEENPGERAVVSAGPMEDAQRLAWSLVRWARQRLYLIGVLDLGYDSQKRPVALRLSPQGARLLGVPVANTSGVPRLGTLVVTPDFEVVLFPSGDDSELMHDLDRFCAREKTDELRHLRIQERTVRRALVQGMRLDEILRTLELHSRTPVPQNVSFSIRDWAVQAGLMVLSDDLELRSDNPEILRRLSQDPGARGHVERVLCPNSVKLKGRITPRRMRALLRELGYLVELRSSNAA